MQQMHNSFGMSNEFFTEVTKRLFFERDELLKIPFVRAMLAQARYEALSQSRGINTQEGEYNLDRTVSYNKSALTGGAGLERVTQLVAPLLGLSSHFPRLNQLDVLAVGPRSESEIMALASFGFSLPRIKAVDIITYSPLVTLMDVSRMTFPDSSFDVAVVGWVIVYLADPVPAIRELVRVMRPGGIISVGVDYSDRPLTAAEVPEGAVQRNRYYSSPEDILREFGDSVGKVVFTSPAAHPTAPWLKHVVATFEVQK